MKKSFGWLILLLATCPGKTLGEQRPETRPPLLREDIKVNWEKRLCTSRQAPTIRELWQSGIYDAQLQGHFMTLKEGLRTTPDLMTKAAAILAGRAGHNGFHFGICPETAVGWVVTSPAPGSYIQRTSENSIYLNWTRIRAYCYEARIDYAAASGRRPRNLMTLTIKSRNQDVRIDDGLLDNGSISITCYPQYAKNLGPELWYLLPVKAGPSTEPPGMAALVEAEGNYAPAIQRWINGMRTAARLPALAEVGTMDHGHDIDQDLLALNESIHHDTQHLKSVESMIRKSGGIFIGENRVKGQDLSEMAWLLWNSPRHRDLLLSARADSLVVSQINEKTGRLVVLTFARYTKGIPNVAN